MADLRAVQELPGSRRSPEPDRRRPLGRLHPDRKKFRDGAITLEAFSLASHNFNGENAKKLQIQLQQEITKYDLEDFSASNSNRLPTDRDNASNSSKPGLCT